MGTEIKAAALPPTLGSFTGDANVKARMFSGFTRQQLKLFLSVGKPYDLLTPGHITPAERS